MHSSRRCRLLLSSSITQDVHGAQLAEIVESTRCYADALADQRTSIDCQEVMLARLWYTTAKLFSENDKNGTVSHKGTDLLREVGQPTIGSRFEDHKQWLDRTLLATVGCPYHQR
ncbi:hypothetical protein M9H77_03035 [Catharanthus roseus]|uniref:Uncharacterized protein n=1 Tax=Catharanthus roseus TaxID=4058 RepID=A0ACC0CAD9_CATRO|nr:hypothetical protein M9H77_03035 [Catharanthus roseus]